MPDLHITQIKSVIGSVQKQRATLRGLGLRRIRDSVVQPDRPEIRGMIAKVSHLVEVRDAADGEVISPRPKRSDQRRAASQPASKPSAAEQHPKGLTKTPQPDASTASRPSSAAPGAGPERPAAPDSPASPTATAPEDQPDTGPSGEPSSKSAPGTVTEDAS